MKNKYVLILSCFLVLLSFSFTTKLSKDLSQDTILFEDIQVKIKSHLVEYKVPNRSVVKNYLLLTIENKTRKNIVVEYTRRAYYNGKCYSCNSPESQFKIVLKKKEIKSGDLSSNDKSLKVFHSFKTGESKSKLTELIIDNVIIKNL